MERLRKWASYSCTPVPRFSAWLWLPRDNPACGHAWVLVVKPLKVEQSRVAYCICEKLWRLLEGEVLQERVAKTEGNAWRAMRASDRSAVRLLSM